MAAQNYLLTSESVSEGHPDKLCDQISDSVLDVVLSQDPNGRVACESACANDLVLVFGEITATAEIDFEKIVRNVYADAGYVDPEYGVSADTLRIIREVSEQSKDIKAGVDKALEVRGDADADETGAGDQGMVFGYATDETPEMMPLPIVIAHKLTRRLAQLRKNKEIPYLRPDAKSQVTVEYSPENVPVRVQTVLVSTQHDPGVSNQTIHDDTVKWAIDPILEEYGMAEKDIRRIVNPSGRFVIGGPVGDAGLTGRKIIADTYGGIARHGGGAFSGKDPTKVDRSAAYAARHVAKNIVLSGAAKRAEIQISYGIGMAEPISIMVDTFGTGRTDDHKITELVKRIFDLRPGAIIRNLRLRRPIFRQVATYGHFGRCDFDLPWEKADRAEEIAATL